MKRPPINPYLTAGGLYYLPRMLDKIRKHAAGELHEDYHANLGISYDARMCHVLGVSYADIRARTLAGGTDEEIFAWCEAHGRKLNDIDRLIWNGFASKRGWRDDASATLERDKAASGFADRADLQTFFDYWVADDARLT